MVVTDLSNSFHPVPKTRQKIVEKELKNIKKASSKQKKIERDRDKNIIKKGYCQYCGKYSNRLDPHEVYGGSNRKRSIKNKFIALICRSCHDNEEILKEHR